MRVNPKCLTKRPQLQLRRPVLQQCLMFLQRCNFPHGRDEATSITARAFLDITGETGRAAMYEVVAADSTLEGAAVVPEVLRTACVVPFAHGYAIGT